MVNRIKCFYAISESKHLRGKKYSETTYQTMLAAFEDIATATFTSCPHLPISWIGFPNSALLVVEIREVRPEKLILDWYHRAN